MDWESIIKMVYANAISNVLLDSNNKYRLAVRKMAAAYAALRMVVPITNRNYVQSGYL